MKTIKFFAMAAAVLAIGLTSCTKNNGGETPDVKGHKATITIGVQSAETRAIGAIANDADNKINNFLAFAFRADGQLDGTVIESIDGLAVTSTGNVTTATTEIYIVANATKSDFNGVTTKSGLEAVTGTLANAGVSSQTSAAGGNVWASGFQSVTFTKTPSNVYEATANVSIKFVAARINVTVVNNMTNQAAVGAFTVTDIALMNVTSTTKFFGASLIPAVPTYYSGIDMTSFANKPVGYSITPFLTDVYTSGTANHYYVFENNATDFPTILTLIASYDGGITYAPIHFDLSDAREVIERGNSYNVTLTLTGSADPGDNENPGTEDPTNPIVKANITVSVTVESWIPKTITKEF